MRYVLECDHPRVVDTDMDPDESYYELVLRKKEHWVPVKSDEEARQWVERHVDEVVKHADGYAYPRPQRLIKVIKSW